MSSRVLLSARVAWVGWNLNGDEWAKEERAASGSLVDGTDVFSNAKLVVQCDGEQFSGLKPLERAGSGR